ncbi:MAG: glutamate--tRNA ligase [Candidatus Micrarchaeaceae archaeon]
MPIKKEINDMIRKYAVKNAIDYGKARMENVFGKVIREVPKDQTGELRIAIQKIIDEVNSLSKGELENEYKNYEKEFDEKYEKKVETTSKPKMVLEGAVKGDFATRFAPEPSGYMHLGHANAAYLAQEFAKIYEGKIFLYFDDSNPEKESQEFVDAFRRDLNWLGIKFDKEYFASDSMEKIYEYAKMLISSGNAYACECNGEEIKKYRFEGTECKHRNASPSDNLNKFEMMLANKYDEEKIVIRFKGDMKSLNTALRDPTILRIKKANHYRQGTKYIVWPLYDFNTPINDSINGVTDAIRTKEYELRGPLYDMVLDALQLRKPRMHLHARIPIKDNITSKRELNKLIKDGYIKGYDDPRLITISALRRRGIKPEAIREFVLRFGMSKAESSVDISMLLDENKKLIDPTAKRLYYIPGPVDLTVKNFESAEIEIKLHPSNDLGSRKYIINNRFYISGEDASNLKDHEVIKLKELFNVEVEREKDGLVGNLTEMEFSKDTKRVQWVSDGNYIPCKIFMPGSPLDEKGEFNPKSLRINEGYVENYAARLDDHEIIQFERFGFCILDDKSKMQFIFISK